PEVFCDFGKSCILPCSFEAGYDSLIHWYQQKEAEISVHSFYHEKVQLDLQDERFRGRTSLFEDQISKGNASLELSGVEVQDQGRYKCYTSTTRGEESFIHLRVDAPVGEVSIQQV
ncbi:V-set domain-containing T-cell activation inhibitor 1-like, partial [Plectropomus leopardus]|uniref:V-set domain-containing T-cell activation inhibitor 1-like n=1 Tax=Plectropomus leopardus TaxID=160734 RepID=UPI001C4B93E8